MQRESKTVGAGTNGCRFGDCGGGLGKDRGAGYLERGSDELASTSSRGGYAGAMWVLVSWESSGGRDQRWVIPHVAESALSHHMRMSLSFS